MPSTHALQAAEEMIKHCLLPFNMKVQLTAIIDRHMEENSAKVDKASFNIGLELAAQVVESRAKYHEDSNSIAADIRALIKK